MGATNLQESLLDAVQLLSTNAANNTTAAITIQATITGIEDEGLHLYNVKYGENIFNAYADSISNYKVGDVVYILVPNGDLNEQKIIIGSTAPKATMYVAEEESNLYVPISDNLFGNSITDVDLKSWDNNTYIVNIPNKEFFSTIFNDYLDTNKNFTFSAKIKTEIPTEHQVKGNYGLLLTLPFVEINDTGAEVQTSRTFNMDVTTIQGNPYRFDVYQKVELYYTIDDSLKYDITRQPELKAFVKDFGYLDDERSDLDPADIHIRDISFNVVDTLTESEAAGYKLTVVASEGNYFLAGPYVHKKTLSPILKINGKTTNTSSWECYWFQEDVSIGVGSDGYSTFGGLGWKCLNDKTNIVYDSTGKQTFQYVTNKYTLDVSSNDVKTTLRYKCVLIQNDVLVSGVIKLKNLNSTDKLTLFSKTGSNVFAENIGTVSLIARLYSISLVNQETGRKIENTDSSLSWARYDSAGDPISENFEDTFTIVRDKDIVNIGTEEQPKYVIETEVEYPCSKLDKINTIKCTFFSSIINDDIITKNNLGTEEIVVTTSKNFVYGLTIDGGDALYKYDADGDSPMVANYDGPLSSRVQTINPISYRIFKANGQELTDSEYLYCKYTWSFPKNSMMKLKNIEPTKEDDNYYYIKGTGKSNLNYTILSVFNKNKSNNSILLNVEFDNNSLNASTNMKFLKDGESGTNGTKYSAIVTYDGYGYGEKDAEGKIRKFQAVYLESQGWKIYDQENNEIVDFGTPHFNISVYKDGEKINSGYTLSWGMFDAVTTNPCFGIVGGNLSISTEIWNNPETIYCNIIEVKVTIAEDAAVINGGDTVYAYYPIEITRLKTGLENSTVPSLIGGFEQVLYASDGTNPQYDNTNPFSCIDSLYNDDLENIFDYNWSASNNLNITNNIREKEVTIKPISKYNNGDSKNYVKAVLSMSDEKKAAIEAEKVALTRERENTNNLKNKYLENNENVVDFIANFDYNNSIEKLDNAKLLLSYRNDMINYIFSMQDSLEEINSFCIKNQIQISDFNYVDYYSRYMNTLNTAYNNLYKLGYRNSLDTISDLSYIKLVLNESNILKYGAGILNQLKNLVQTYNLILTNKYQVTYAKIKQKENNEYVLKEAFDNLHDLEADVIQLPNKMSYRLYEEGNPEEEIFETLKNQLSTLAGKIDKPESKELLSYTAFDDNLLKSINELLTIYNNREYQERKYNEKNVELQQLLDYYDEQINLLTQALLSNNTDYIVHIKPIVMLFNRYEMGNINAWNGNKLYIDNRNNEYLLAPQVGAGTKNNGLFTGVIMGIKNFNDPSSGSPEIGLFGYHNGVQSIFLNAKNGSATFGKSGAGQIIIDPSSNKAIIKSGNYSTSSGTGMQIDLSKPRIDFGSGNFAVSPEGYLTAKGGGEIGGWQIRTGYLQSKTGNTTLSSDGTITCSTLIAKTSGQIGGYTISGSQLTGNGIILKDNNINVGDGGTISCGGVTMGNGSIWGDKFNLSGAGLTLSAGSISIGDTSWNGSGFSGGGNATYSSTAGNPFGGTCVTQINTLIANTVTADYISAKVLTTGREASFGSLGCTYFHISGDGPTVYLSRADFASLKQNAGKQIPTGGTVFIQELGHTYNITLTYS